MVKVPTKDGMTGAAMHGISNGGISGLGQALGRSLLGPSLGTAAGGIVAAAAMDDQASRNRAAERAIEDAMTATLGGGGASSSTSSSSSRGHM